MSVEVKLYRGDKRWSVLYEGRVVAHTKEAFAWDISFEVDPKGRVGLRKLKRKIPHAFVICQMDDLFLPMDSTILEDLPMYQYEIVGDLGQSTPLRVSYDPYKHTSFMLVEKIEEEGEGDKEVFTPISSASHVYLDRRGSLHVDRIPSPPALRPASGRGNKSVDPVSSPPLGSRRYMARRLVAREARSSSDRC